MNPISITGSPLFAPSGGPSAEKRGLPLTEKQRISPPSGGSVMLSVSRCFPPRSPVYPSNTHPTTLHLFEKSFLPYSFRVRVFRAAFLSFSSIPVLPAGGTSGPPLRIPCKKAPKPYSRLRRKLRESKRRGHIPTANTETNRSQKGNGMPLIHRPLPPSFDFLLWGGLR